MGATGDSIHLHPDGTLGNGNLSCGAASGQESDQVVVIRRPTRSFSDATPYRRRVRDKIFAAMFTPNSSDGTGGKRTSDPVVMCLAMGSFGSATLCCGEIFAYLLKREHN